MTVNCPEGASSDGSAKSDVEARQDLSPEHADLVSGKVHGNGKHLRAVMMGTERNSPSKERRTT